VGHFISSLNVLDDVTVDIALCPVYFSELEKNMRNWHANGD